MNLRIRCVVKTLHVPKINPQKPKINSFTIIVLVWGRCPPLEPKKSPKKLVQSYSNTHKTNKLQTSKLDTKTNNTNLNVSTSKTKTQQLLISTRIKGRGQNRRRLIVAVDLWPTRNSLTDYIGRNKSKCL